jgi:hypothetical protein
MTMKHVTNILIFLFLTSCGQSNSEQTAATFSDKETTDSLQPDKVELKETFNEDDLPVNDYLTDRLKPIRTNFKRINSITNWASIDTEELWESTEGGEAKFYYQNGQLEKIVARHYGETFQLLTEYYLLNGQLSFVFEKFYKYNRPFYWDTTAMKEYNDTEAFDFDKSEIIEDRSYFDNGKLIHQISNQDCGSPFADDYLLEEQKRIKTDFDKLIGLSACNLTTGRQTATDDSKSQNNSCVRGQAEPIIKKSIYPNTTFVLQPDGLTAIETVTLDNGDKLIIHNWGCESYVLTFRFETSRLKADTATMKYWYVNSMKLMNEIKQAIDAPIDVEKGIEAVNQYISKNVFRLELQTEIDFGTTEIKNFVTLDSISRIDKDRFAVTISFAIGSL